MLFFLCILVVLIFNKIEFSSANEFQIGYLAKNNTNAIKGIFVVLVFFRHYSQYIHFDGKWDEPFLILDSHLNQMIVAMFLFYSGYGIMESIKKKGFTYVSSIPSKRLLKVFVNFCIAVGCYGILDFVLQIKYDIKTILFAFTGWTNIGNSNWYMFAIFALYILTFLSFYFLKYFDSSIAKYIYSMILTILTMCLVLWEIRVGKETWYYNTMILYCAGVWYSLLKDKIEKIVMRNDLIYFCFLAVGISAYYYTFQNRFSYGIEGYTIWALVFVMLILLVTMKISVHNSVLTWLGEHLFWIYILQRLPMILLTKIGAPMYDHRYFFLIWTIVVTIVLALFFEWWTSKMWNKLGI